MFNREDYEKRIKTSTFLRKYMCLPAMAVTPVIAFFEMQANQYDFMTFYIIVFLLNSFAYWLHGKLIDIFQEHIEILNQTEQMSRIRELNPHNK